MIEIKSLSLRKIYISLGLYFPLIVIKEEIFDRKLRRNIVIENLSFKKSQNIPLVLHVYHDVSNIAAYIMLM